MNRILTELILKCVALNYDCVVISIFIYDLSYEITSGFIRIQSQSTKERKASLFQQWQFRISKRHTEIELLLYTCTPNACSHRLMPNNLAAFIIEGNNDDLTMRGVFIEVGSWEGSSLTCFFAEPSVCSPQNTCGLIKLRNRQGICHNLLSLQ